MLLDPGSVRQRQHSMNLSNVHNVIDNIKASSQLNKVGLVGYDPVENESRQLVIGQSKGEKEK